MSKEKWPKLPVKFKEKWVAALRSGKYKQDSGKYLLETPEGKFCCLGVACKVAGIGNTDNRLEQEWIEHIEGYEFKGIPKLLMGNDELPKTLASMNDSGNSFKFIATWIEKNL
jgi:hypothetical protein